MIRLILSWNFNSFYITQGAHRMQYLTSKQKDKMKIKLSILFVLTLSNTFLFGQNIEGIITDKKEIPITGAYIFHLGNDEHSHSNEKGIFLLKGVNVGDSLQVTHVGYEKRTVVVQTLEKLSIQLSEETVSLDEIVITPRLDALNLFTEIDLKIHPVNSSQEILRQVPGLFIGQHAGGGKSEQMFLRGFDIDHGTDINISVDGLPVNMVSHAHGQGYSDLHFVIPETIDKIDFGKGTYYADKGNFTTAGFVNFETKKRLENSLIKMEAGQFNSQRLLGIFDVLKQSKNSAYLAAEYITTDGAFESPQNFNRINLMGKYTGYINNNDELSILTSYFTSGWDASGQIPQRAVDDGSITRFGSIDDTEGGNTSRTNILIDYNKFIDKNSFIKNSVYYSNYDFELYSNFTFFLDDPINGDQIKQKENRSIFGINSEYNKTFSSSRISGNWQAGISLRNDLSLDNELSHTANRLETLSYTQLGDINESNFGAYVNSTFNIGNWIINPAFRLDYFKFNYYDKLVETYETLSETKSIVSPKLNVLYNPTDELQLYLKTGKGFHSNDTRVVVAQGGEEILPAAYSADLGFIWKPLTKMVINVAYWNLYLEQEFVYVGDAGIVEPSGKTKRQGLDLSLRYQPLDWLIWDIDANYSHARSVDDPEGHDYIPLAPDFTLASGLNVIHPSGIYGGVNVRHINDRPANEDNSIVAAGYTVVDMNVGYQWDNFDFGIQIQNLMDTKWNETQFATESRLQYETTSVEEIHFTPGTPFFIKGSVAFKF